MMVDGVQCSMFYVWRSVTSVCFVFGTCCLLAVFFLLLLSTTR